MSLPPQPPSPEEKEQPTVLHSPADAPTLPSPTSDPFAEETEQRVALYSSEEETPTLPSPTSDPLAEETEQEVWSSEPDGDEASVLNEDEASVLDEDEDFESEESLLPSALQPGVFIHKSILIAAACAVVVAALVVALLVFVNLPKDPPTDWIASTPSSASASTAGKTLYYLHWTNQNGDLKGQLQLAAKANNVPQSLTAVTTGLYNRDNHIIYVVVIVNGQPNTLTGTINAANDTLTLNLVDGSGQSNPLVFHTGSANDYNQAVKKLK